MRRIIPLKNVTKTYEHPILFDIMNKLTTVIGAPSDTVVTHTDVFVKHQPLDNRTQAAFKYTDITPMRDRQMFSQELNNEVPIVMDSDSGFFIKPSYSKKMVNVNYRFESTSLTEVEALLENLKRMLYKRHIFYMEGNGSFSLPDLAIKYCIAVGENKRTRLSLDNSVEEIVQSMMDSRANITSNLSGNIAGITGQDNLRGITVNFTDRSGLRIEKDKESSLYLLETSIEITFKVPMTLQLRFEPMMYNSFLDPSLLPHDKNVEDFYVNLDSTNYVLNLVKMNSLDTWILKDGIIINGPFAGFDTLDPTLNGLVTDFVNKEEIIFEDGFITTGILTNLDLGISFNGTMENIPPSEFINVTLVNGKVVGGIFDGYDTGTNINDLISIEVINHVVYDGLLSGAVEYPYVGGVFIPHPTEEDVIIVSGGIKDGATWDGLETNSNDIPVVSIETVGGIKTTNVSHGLNVITVVGNKIVINGDIETDFAQAVKVDDETTMITAGGIEFTITDLGDGTYSIDYLGKETVFIGSDDDYDLILDDNTTFSIIIEYGVIVLTTPDLEISAFYDELGNIITSVKKDGYDVKQAGDDVFINGTLVTSGYGSNFAQLVTTIGFVFGSTETINGKTTVSGGMFNGVDIDTSRIASGISSLELTTYNNHLDAKETTLKSGTTFLRVPSYDQFNPDISPVYSKIATIMLQVDNSGLLFKLDDIGVASLSDEMIELIRTHCTSDELFTENGFPLRVSIYVGDTMLYPSQLSFDPDSMSISINGEVDLSKIYRLCITSMTDLSYLYNRDLAKALYHDPVIGKTFSLLTGNIDLDRNPSNQGVYSNMILGTVFTLSVYVYFKSKGIGNRITESPGNFWIGGNFYGNS